MVPTYFRRELRDRVLQRRPRLRTFVCLVCACRNCVPDTLAVQSKSRCHAPAWPGHPVRRGVSVLATGVSGILDRPPSRAM